MKFSGLFAVPFVLLTAAFLQAAELPVSSCEAQKIRLNNVFNMRTYSLGTVKAFEIAFDDRPTAPAAVAITIDRGNEGSKTEKFCRLVSGISSVDLSRSRTTYNIVTNVLVLTIEGAQLNDKGVSIPRTLSLTIDKAARGDDGLVKADIK